MKQLNKQHVKKIFKDYLIECGYKDGTISWKMQYFSYIFNYFDEDVDFRDITENQIKDFLVYIETVLSEKRGRLLSKRTKTMIFGTVRLLFRCLYTQDFILANPMQDIVYKAKGEERQKEILTQEEMSSFLDKITEEKHLGLRDRAIFELMYSSGLRVSEVAKLKVGDIDFEERMLLAKEAKWGKDRIVPVSKVAMKFLKLYLASRIKDKEAPVFLGEQGKIGAAMINNRFKKLLKQFGMYREGVTAHSIRHSVATHLLSNGADLRFVQELLAHESIETTCIYTNDFLENIKKVYKSYHPFENEYYKEVDEEYLNRLDDFYSALAARMAGRDKRREARRKYYLKNIEKIKIRKKEWREKRRKENVSV